VVIISEHLDTKTNSKLTLGQESCHIPNTGDIKSDKFQLMEVSKEAEQWTKEKVEVMP